MPSNGSIYFGPRYWDTLLRNLREIGYLVLKVFSKNVNDWLLLQLMIAYCYS